MLEGHLAGVRGHPVRLEMDEGQLPEDDIGIKHVISPRRGGAGRCGGKNKG